MVLRPENIKSAASVSYSRLHGARSEFIQCARWWIKPGWATYENHLGAIGKNCNTDWHHLIAAWQGIVAFVNPSTISSKRICIPWDIMKMHVEISWDLVNVFRRNLNWLQFYKSHCVVLCVQWSCVHNPLLPLSSLRIWYAMSFILSKKLIWCRGHPKEVHWYSISLVGYVLLVSHTQMGHYCKDERFYHIILSLIPGQEFTSWTWCNDIWFLASGQVRIHEKSCFPFWIRPLSLPYPWPRIGQGYSTDQMRVKPGSRIFTHWDLQLSSQDPNSLHQLANNNIKMHEILHPINHLQVDTRSATCIVQAWCIFPRKPRIE